MGQVFIAILETIQYWSLICCFLLGCSVIEQNPQRELILHESYPRVFGPFSVRYSTQLPHFQNGEIKAINVGNVEVISFTGRLDLILSSGKL